MLATSSDANKLKKSGFKCLSMTRRAISGRPCYVGGAHGAAPRARAGRGASRAAGRAAGRAAVPPAPRVDVRVARVSHTSSASDTEDFAAVSASAAVDAAVAAVRTIEVCSPHHAFLNYSVTYNWHPVT